MSRGPVTQEGKARSSQNALKHGLRSQKALVIDPNEQEEYNKFRSDMFDAIDPQDYAQSALADRVVQNAWRLRQLVEIETAMLRDNVTRSGSLHLAFTYHGDINRFGTLGRYEYHIEQSMYKALHMIAVLKKATAVRP
jgi:hypothetical protein